MIDFRILPRERIDRLEKAILAARQIPDEHAVMVHLGNRGTAHSVVSDFSKALELDEQQLSIAKWLGDRDGEMAAVGNLANLFSSS